MGDVIEACADGGFDIPATPIAIRTTTLTSFPSKILVSWPVMLLISRILTVCSTYSYVRVRKRKWIYPA